MVTWGIPSLYIHTHIILNDNKWEKHEKELDKNPGSHLERVTLSRCLPHSWPLSPAEGEMMTNRCPKCCGNAGSSSGIGVEKIPNQI